MSTRRHLTLSIQVGCGVLLTELLLRIFFPIAVPGFMGTLHAPNAALYGWGFPPHAPVQVADPDTRQIYRDTVNSRGWRDVEHTLKKPPGIYRIVVLGDSNTFGAIVPRRSLYTRLLEMSMKQRGYRVEVISLAYGGWGTDQQLEAFVKEGQFYQPDLVILQFSRNDLMDILPTDVQPGRPARPFAYKLTDDGELLRESNPEFVLPSVFSTFLHNREIVKFGYRIWLGKRFSLTTEKHYSFAEAQLEQLRLALAPASVTELIQYLRPTLNSPLTGDQLTEIIARAGLSQHKEIIQRVGEDLPFRLSWRPEHFIPEYSNPETQQWRLFSRLLAQLVKFAAEGGAVVAVLSDSERGLLSWEQFWYRVAASEEAAARYFSLIETLDQVSAGVGARLIPSRYPIERAQYDPHPNIRGNQAMASSIEEFLLSAEGRTFTRFPGPN